MNKHLPLDEFEREVQRLADGFEIQPRALVFENIRSEIAVDTPHAGTKGKILKGAFSKSLNFISYAAAASVATVGTVLVYQQQESVVQQQKSLSSYNKVQSHQSKQLTHNLSNTTDTISYVTAQEEMSVKQQQLQNEAAITKNPVEKESVHTNVSKSEVAVTSKVKARPAEKLNQALPSGLAARKETKVKVSNRTQGENVAQADVTHKSSNEQLGAVSSPTVGVTKSQEQSPEKNLVVVKESVDQMAVTADQKIADNDSKQAVELPVVVKNDSVPSVTVLGTDSLVTTVAITAIVDSTVNDTTGAKRIAAGNWMKKGVWSVAAFFSQEFNNRKLEVPVASDPGYYYSSYQNFRNTTDQQSTSFTAGFKAEYNFLNHFGVATGLTYAQRKEQISVDKHKELEYNIYEGTWNTRTTTTAGHSEMITNTFTYIEVPVLLNYNNTLSGRFAYRLSAGISYAYLVQQQAYFIDLDNRMAIMGPAPVYAKESYTGSTPFRQHNFNLQLGAYVSYLVGPQVEVFAGPNYKRSLLSTFNDKYPFRQKYSATGAELGVRMYF